MGERNTAGGEIRVHLFGGPSVSRGGVAVSLSPRQAQLVSVVFGHSRPVVSRAEAIWLIWGQDPDTQERHRLRQLLHMVHRKVGARLIEADGDGLQPASDPASDVADYSALLAEGCLAEAAELLSRGFAEGLRTEVGRELTDWRDARAVTLEEELIRAATRKWHESESRDWMAAVDAAEALHRIRPHDPDNVCRLIESQARTGQVGAAEAAYAGYVASVGEGGLVPSGMTQTMSRIRELSRKVDPRPRVGVPDTPLVGRREELAVACARLADTESDACTVLAIRGEAGIGKSRLAEEIRQEAVLRGYRCLSAGAVELEQQIALNPILDALSGVDIGPYLDDLGQPWKAIVGSLLPPNATDGPPGVIPAIQESSLSRRLMDSFWMLFDRIAEDAPLLLLIDDVQWADPTSIALLQFLERRWDAGRLVLLYTVRREPLSGNSPIDKLLEQHTSEAMDIVDLLELSDTDAQTLLKAVVGEELDSRPEKYLRDLAANHPFYIVELAKDYVSGRLTLPEPDVETVPIPASLRQVFDGRIRELSQLAIYIAGILAVREKPVSLSDLAQLADAELSDCTNAVEQLEMGHFAAVRGSRVVIEHELYRAAFHERLTKSRRAFIHLRIAELLSASEGAGTHGEIAVHYDRAGAGERAVESARRAALEAGGSGALAAAAEYYGIVAEWTSDPAERADAAANRATLLYLDRQIPSAVPALQLASRALQNQGDYGRARLLEIRRIEGLLELRAIDTNEVLSRLRCLHAEAELEDDLVAAALALDAQLHLWHRNSNVGAVRSVLSDLRLLLPRATPEAACICCIGLAMEALFGDPSVGARFADEAIRQAEALSADYQLKSRVRKLAVDLIQGVGYLPQSRTTLKEARCLARGSGDLAQRYYLEANQGVLHLEVGDIARAEAAFDAASDILGRKSLSLSRLNDDYNRAELLIAKGAYETAHGVLRQTLAQTDKDTPKSLRELIVAGLGTCALRLGKLGEARRMEAQLTSDLGYLTFDASPIFAFRADLLRRRGECLAAQSLLEAGRCQTEGRLVLAWLRLTYELARLNRRTGVGDVLSVGNEGLEVCRDLQLLTLATRFEVLMQPS